MEVWVIVGVVVMCIGLLISGERSLRRERERDRDTPL